MLPVPTVEDLAEFTGRDPASFTAFAEQALAQSTLLFSVTTGLDEYPADPDDALLAESAILEMADRIYLEQPYATTKASPFQSETIMSYSYSKALAVAKGSGGKTGLLWWDLAVDKLTVPGTSTSVATGSIPVYDEALTVGGEDYHLLVDGRRYLISPAELASRAGPVYYNPNTRTG